MVTESRSNHTKPFIEFSSNIYSDIPIRSSAKTNSLETKTSSLLQQHRDKKLLHRQVQQFLQKTTKSDPQQMRRISSILERAVMETTSNSSLNSSLELESYTEPNRVIRSAEATPTKQTKPKQKKNNTPSSSPISNTYPNLLRQSQPEKLANKQIPILSLPQNKGKISPKSSPRETQNNHYIHYPPSPRNPVKYDIQEKEMKSSPSSSPTNSIPTTPTKPSQTTLTTRIKKSPKTQELAQKEEGNEFTEFHQPTSSRPYIPPLNISVSPNPIVPPLKIPSSPSSVNNTSVKFSESVNNDTNTNFSPVLQAASPLSHVKEIRKNDIISKLQHLTREEKDQLVEMISSRCRNLEKDYSYSMLDKFLEQKQKHF